MSTPAPYDPEAFKRFERAGWVEVAAGYDDAFSALTRQAVEPLLNAAGVGAGTRLLDVATGPGYVAAAAARRGASAAGLDFSPAMVAEARRRHPEVEFHEGDAEALPFTAGAFDAVTIGFGLVHFARPERAIAEAFRVLRSAGRFAFTVWDAPDRAVTFGLVLQAVEASGQLDVPLPAGPPFFQFSDPGECRGALAAAGFAAPQVRTFPLAWRVDSSDALIQKFLSGGVRTRALLLAQTPHAMHAIRATLSELVRPYQRRGGLELPGPCVLATAVKP